MDFIFKIGKKIIPGKVFNFFQPAYHYALGFLGALAYGFPSKKLTVIGVTGTKGKTTTSYLITQILNSAGFKTGMATTVLFKIGDKEWLNESKQTMLGRFQLQKLLSRMVREECKYAVIETSSEGILQHRHRFIDYDMAVFTNLSPEHIERHGGFENYRDAKVKLFKKVARKAPTPWGRGSDPDTSVGKPTERRLRSVGNNCVGVYPPTHSGLRSQSRFNNKILQSNFLNGIKKFFKFGLRKNKLSTMGVGVYNLDDQNVKYFLEPKVSRQYVYSAKIPGSLQIPNLSRISDIKSGLNGTTFLFSAGDKSERMEMPLVGEFNVYNAAAAICAVSAQGVSLEEIKKALVKIKAPPGRLEIIGTDRGFSVIIDYAHEPVSLEAVYKTSLKLKTRNSKLICLLGAQGGGRDKWKRPEMGKVAAKYCDKIILTNEDPYDEKPQEIIDDIEAGIRINQKNRHKSAVYKIIDRREAIKKALSLAKKGDVVILIGKGGEMWMCVKNGKKIAWDEKKIAEELL